MKLQGVFSSCFEHRTDVMRRLCVAVPARKGGGVEVRSWWLKVGWIGTKVNFYPIVKS